ncbi:hypothetical protein PMAYCL1PPCAC_04503, partial [Pristionchus mayeri]
TTIFPVSPFLGYMVPSTRADHGDAHLLSLLLLLLLSRSRSLLSLDRDRSLLRSRDLLLLLFLSLSLSLSLLLLLFFSLLSFDLLLFLSRSLLSLSRSRSRSDRSPRSLQFLRLILADFTVQTRLLLGSFCKTSRTLFMEFLVDVGTLGVDTRPLALAQRAPRRRRHP